jgi:hypothetical protein
MKSGGAEALRTNAKELPEKVALLRLTWYLKTLVFRDSREGAGKAPFLNIQGECYANECQPDPIPRKNGTGKGHPISDDLSMNMDCFSNISLYRNRHRNRNRFLSPSALNPDFVIANPDPSGCGNPSPLSALFIVRVRY